MKKLILSLALALLCVLSARGDSITGEFVDMLAAPVPFYSPGSIVEFPGYTLRYVQVAGEGWNRIPYDYQWVTKGNAFAWDGTSLTQAGGVFEDWTWKPGWALALSEEQEADIAVHLEGALLRVLYRGYEIGSGTVTQSFQAESVSIPEPPAWALLGAGLVSLRLGALRLERGLRRRRVHR